MTDDDWRARKKAATKQSIQEHALRLFNEKSYDATTVEEIAAAAGVSHMTLERMRKAGTAPRHVQLSARRIGYRICDLTAWLDARAGA